MNLGLQARREGFAAQLSVDGHTFTLISDAQETFPGLLEVVPALDPSMSLGADPREKVVLHVDSQDLPAVLAGPDAPLEHFLTDEDGNKWKTVHRENNPADITVKFEVVKIVKGQDQ